MAEETTTYHNPDATESWPELSAEPVDKRPIAFGILAVVIFLIIFGVIAYFLYVNPQAAAIIRDISIVFLGLGTFLIILLLIVLIVITAYLVLKVNDLVNLLDREIKPILFRLQDTAGTVQGTTNFLSENAVKPVIKTVSTFAAAQSAVRTLFRRN